MTAPARAALYAAFALSGAAALIYESIWSRYLGLLLGHSAHAQVLVLTVFLGGMAVGAALAGWRTTALRSPLLWYAGVEVIIGVFGFAFHSAFGAVSGAAYDTVFPALRSSTVSLAVAKSFAAALLILPQSILLGATFPLMSAAVLRRMPDRAGGVLGWLYASNSLGASLGVLVAGFYLLGRFGFTGTLVTAALLNLLAGALAIAIHLSLARSRADPARSTEAAADVAEPAFDPRLRRLLLIVALGTAVASFAYEIAWIRMLSLVLGSATHSFELMLSAFILGLGLGALWIGIRGDRIRDPVRTLLIVQCVMGAMAAATLPLYVASFEWTADLMTVFSRTPEGYSWFTMARYGICLVIMLPATICAGMTLPLITRVLYRAGARESAIGEVYGANTVGSILGVQLAALILLPALGLKLLLVGAALTDIALGAALVSFIGSERSRARLLALATVPAVVVVVLGAWLSPFDQRMLNAGVFRTGRILQVDNWVMLYHRDGRTATVTARRSEQGDVILATNGKPDASLSSRWFKVDSTVSARATLRSDEQTQLLLPLIGLAHRPDARSIAVIGHGSGITSHILLGAPRAEQVTTIEIEPEMVRASMVFFPFNRRVFEDPRSRLVVDDARAFFARSAEPFDLIVSEPSNPWVSGVSGLFTKEFYARVRQHLSDNGILAQWLNLYEMNDGLVRSVLAAVQSVFPHYDVYIAGESDIVVIATAGQAPARPDWSIVDHPGIHSELAPVPRLTPEVFDALYLAGSDLLSPFVRVAQANSDFVPILDLEAERARYIGNTAVGFRTLNAVSYDFVRALTRQPLPLSQGTVPAVAAERMQLRALSARLRAPVPRDSVITDGMMVAALQRRRTHDAVIASGRPPVNWQLWAQDVALIDREIHSGSAGVSDERFFAPIESYVRRVGAPPGPRNAVQFLRALTTWDFATAARLSDDLIARQERGEPLVPPDYLRDGAVTAKLMVGDPRGALRAFSVLQKFTRSDAVGAFRSQLLMAQIIRAFSPAKP